ncbi:uncharacterized protein [Musca autumnalis]|uniref:uncharacterized protein n=1 Tax=Musca autumnalis TaxID=221902 RepID=UPI003CFBA65F
MGFSEQHYQKQIDHVLINSKWRSSLLDVRSKRVADINSDHYLVMTKVKLKLASLRSTATKSNRKFDVEKLKVQEHRNASMTSISSQLPHVTNSRYLNINDINTNIINIYNETAKQTIGFNHHKRKVWISNNTWEIIEQRNALNTRISNENGDATDQRTLYKNLSMSIKKSAKRDKLQWNDEQANQAELAARRGDVKSLYKISRTLCGKPTYTNKLIMSENGTLHTATDEQLLRWMEHFKSTLNNPIGLTTPIETHFVANRNITFTGIVDNPPTKQEVHREQK